MATKKTTTTPAAPSKTAATPAVARAQPAAATNGAPAQAAPAAAPTPVQTDPQKILAIKDRKLVRSEVGALRKAGLRKDGSALVKHQGPRSAAEVTLVSVKNAVETFGVEALDKLHKRYGESLRKPLRQYVSTITDGSDDRTAMEALFRSFFPIVRAGGFSRKDDAAVNAQGRATIDLRSIGAVKGDRCSKGEVVTLSDGRVGVFITLTAKAQAAAPAADPAPAQAAAQAAPAWAQPSA